MKEDVNLAQAPLGEGWAVARAGRALRGARRAAAWRRGRAPAERSSAARWRAVKAGPGLLGGKHREVVAEPPNCAARTSAKSRPGETIRGPECRERGFLRPRRRRSGCLGQPWVCPKAGSIHGLQRAPRRLDSRVRHPPRTPGRDWASLERKARSERAPTAQSASRLSVWRLSAWKRVRQLEPARGARGPTRKAGIGPLPSPTPWRSPARAPTVRSPPTPQSRPDRSRKRAREHMTAVSNRVWDGAKEEAALRTAFHCCEPAGVG